MGSSNYAKLSLLTFSHCLKLRMEERYISVAAVLFQYTLQLASVLQTVHIRRTEIPIMPSSCISQKTRLQKSSNPLCMLPKPIHSIGH